jgi:hypothetical protein
MSLWFKNSLAFLTGAAAVILAVAALLSLLWINDVRKDREHTVIVNRATPVFAGSAYKGGCHGTQLMTIDRGATLQVRRITYLKDCAALDVVLPNGRDGYVVLGIGDVSVNPPLPTI